MSPQDWRNDAVTVVQTPRFPTESSLSFTFFVYLFDERLNYWVLIVA